MEQRARDIVESNEDGDDDVTTLNQATSKECACVSGTMVASEQLFQ